MPLPNPQAGESKDDFLGRCMTALQGEFGDQEQRFAVCSGIWEDAKSMDHTQLVEAVRSRKASDHFGYGITTADRYVERIAREVGAGPLAKYFDASNLDEAVKLAGMRLTYAAEDAVKQSLAMNNFAEMLPEGIVPPANTLMLVRHVVTTPREDRDKDVLRTEGAELDPKAPLLWQHLHTMPIGKTLCKLEHTPTRLVICSALLDLNDLTSDVAKLIEADVLRFSHGFIAREWKERKKPDNGNEPLGFEVIRFEIMEVSLVSVPSNVDAEIELWSRGKLESDCYKAHAKGLFDARGKVFLGASVELPGSIISRTMQKGFDVELQCLEASRLEYDWVSRYIGCEIKELIVTVSTIPRFRMGGVLSGFRAVTADWQVKDTRNITRDGKEMPPVHEVVQVNSRNSGTFLTEGLRFFVQPNGEKVCVKFDDDYYGLVVTVYSKIPQSVIDDAWQWATVNAPLQGEAMSLSGAFLSRDDQSLSDIFLEDRNYKPLERSLRIINDKGHDMANRGMILMGPPGTGKTMSGRALMNQADATFIWVSARDFWNMGAVGGLCSAFDLGRELAPSIVFIEDVDNWLSDSTMDVIKTEMDGISRSSGLLTILTTNYPERLPDALIDRPGRFHDVLRFDLPTNAVRSRMLTAWTACDGQQIKSVVDKTQGYSGAHLWELVQYAKTLADEEPCELHHALLKAVDKIDQQRKLIDDAQLSGSRYRHHRSFTSSKTINPAAEEDDDTDLSESAVPEESNKATTTIVGSKYGRVLSEANLKTLEDVASDMEELVGMDLPRPARALCERCIRRIKEVIDRAAQAKPEDSGDEEQDDLRSEEAVQATDHALGHTQRSAASIELADVLLWITNASKSSLDIAGEILKAAVEVQRQNDLARQLRQISR